MATDPRATTWVEVDESALQRDRPINVAHRWLLNEHPELVLVILIGVALLGSSLWSAVVDPGTRSASLSAAAVLVVILGLIVRAIRTGLYVGRQGIVVRRWLRPPIEWRWREVDRFTVGVRPLSAEWRVLRIEPREGDGLWIWPLRTSIDKDYGGPPIEGLAATLDRLRQRATAGEG
jgi:hypothetical protein